MTKQLTALVIFLLTIKISASQPVQGKLHFERGKTLNMQMDIKTSVTQQAMNQAIDFKADAIAIHQYRVTDISKDDNTTLRHEIKKISFNFEGMGQKTSFNSDSTRDMEGPYGEPVKNILSKKFDLTIDANGKTLMIKPEKTDSIKADERLAILLTMLRDVTDVVYPPKKGEASFFKILPSKEIMKGESWRESYQNANGKFNATYTLSDITDSLVIIDFTGTSNTVNKVMMMGTETSTILNNTSTGKIILDKVTGIIKEKTTTTESNGTTEAMGGTLPVTSKTTIIIYVKPE